jgi:hypothetical protein
MVTTEELNIILLTSKSWRWRQRGVEGRRVEHSRFHGGSQEIVCKVG